MDLVRVRLKTHPAETKLVTPKMAEILVKIGKGEIVEPEPPPQPARKKKAPAPPPPPAPEPEPDPEPAEPVDELDAMSYWELRALAKERGLDVTGTKPEVLEALRGTYHRRDMRAEE